MKCNYCHSELEIPKKVKCGLSSKEIVTCTTCGRIYKRNTMILVYSVLIANVAMMSIAVLTKVQIGIGVFAIVYPIVLLLFLRLWPVRTSK